MKLKEYKYRIFSHILWGKRKQHYKMKWNYVKLKYNMGIQIQKLVKKLNLRSKELQKPIIVYFSSFDFFYPLTQRPNHIFKILAKRGFPCLFPSSKPEILEYEKNLFVVPFSCLLDILKYDFPKVMITSFACIYVGNILQYIKNKDLVLYELIDDFDLLTDKKRIKKSKKIFSKLI
nr:hypothetical protein [bacterium]